MARYNSTAMLFKLTKWSVSAACGYTQYSVCCLQVIQLQGDQRKNVATFLVQVIGISTTDQLSIALANPQTFPAVCADHVIVVRLIFVGWDC